MSNNYYYSNVFSSEKYFENNTLSNIPKTNYYFLS